MYVIHESKQLSRDICRVPTIRYFNLSCLIFSRSHMGIYTIGLLLQLFLSHFKTKRTLSMRLL